MAVESAEFDQRKKIRRLQDPNLHLASSPTSFSSEDEVSILLHRCLLTPMDSFCELPEDVQAILLSFVPLIGIARFSMTCVHFRSSGWKFISVIDLDPALKQVQTIAETKSTRCKESILFEKVFQRIVSMFNAMEAAGGDGFSAHRLRKVILESSEPGVADFTSKFLPIVGRRLTSFILGSAAVAAVQILPHLDSGVIRTLDVNVSDWRDAIYIERFLQQCPQLQSLTVSCFNPAVVQSVLQGINKALARRLKEIYLNLQRMFDRVQPQDIFGVEFASLKSVLVSHRESLERFNIDSPNIVSHQFREEFWRVIELDPTGGKPLLGANAHVLHLDSECFIDQIPQKLRMGSE